MAATDDALTEARAALRDKKWNEAEAHARRALRETPTSAGALCALGSALSDRGDDVEALRLFRQAIACDNSFVAAYRALAQRYYLLGRAHDAAELYRDWSRLEPDNPEVQHMTAAVTGVEMPARCSEAYVETHFNHFAQTFDDVLTKRLAYRGPEVVAAALAKHASVSTPTLHVLDAGCGTGLCAPLLRKYCRTLVGVDLSEKMVENARKRGCYDELVVSELCTFIKSRPDTFNAIVSCDVLVYFGALEKVATTASIALKRDGLLIVTVEALTEAGADPYRLQPSGRYSHRDSYLREVMSEAGLHVLSLEEETLRWECGKRVRFYSLVSRKP
jgi:predicted TPR repeat methyltransferase